MNQNQDLALKSLVLSSQRKNFGSNGQPTFILDNNIPNIRGYKLSKFYMPNTIYNIESGRNNRITAILNTTASPVIRAQLPSQNYNGQLLASTLQTQLNSASNGNLGWQISYQTATNLLLVSNTSTNFRLTSGNLIGANAEPHAYFETGLENFVNNNFASSITSENIDLSGVKAIGVNANFGEIKSNQFYNSLIDFVPVVNTFGDYNIYLNDSSDYINCDIQNLDVIKLDLCDNYFRPINPPNDYTLQLNFLVD